MVDVITKQNVFLQRFQFTNSTVLTTYSGYLKGLIKDVSPSSKVEVIPNGVNVTRFPISKNPRKKVIIYVGRMAKIKGVHVLIDSFKEVMKRNPDWSLWLVGGAFDQPKSFFERYISAETEKNIKFLGQIPNEELSEILNDAGIFVMPTIRDGFEIALMEAMATGIPCVTTAAYERSELYGGYAATVPPNDSKALGKELNYIIDNYTDFTADSEMMKRVNRAHEFDWKMIAHRYENLFKELTK
jgi:spore coat protein SA